MGSICFRNRSKRSEGQIGGCKQMNFQLGSNKLLEEHNGVIRMVLSGSHNEWNWSVKEQKYQCKWLSK